MEMEYLVISIFILFFHWHFRTGWEWIDTCTHKNNSNNKRIKGIWESDIKNKGEIKEPMN